MLREDNQVERRGI
ncbi:hypothetical protein PIIN_11308 [Serendipita indica DSM 11827]|uniref:Uncharacterized protein n=1 Tax=Serendipita indica (strain DSM 11827) TaxID=1109443 RepID=G4U188_SERID|nr:hypothetical protein PIIN_11308 [Serendipita indica DSM 11827]